MKAVVGTFLLFAAIVLAMPVQADNPDITISSGSEDLSLRNTVALARTPLQITVATIKEGAVAQVQKLHEQMRAAVPGSEAARELEFLISETKEDCEVAILRAVRADALDRGDSVASAEAEHALDQILNPREIAVESIPSNRPAPAGN